MGLKYLLPYKSIDNVDYHVEIFTDNYDHDPIILRGVSEEATEQDYDTEGTDDPFAVFVKSTLVLNFYNEGNVDMNELQQAADKDFTAKWYRSGILIWQGFIKTEDIQAPLAPTPYKCSISFVCGLTLLDDIPYTHADLFGVDNAISRCPMNYIRQILYADENLGIMLPIRWTNQLQCKAFSDDMFAGSVTWSPFNEGFYSYQQGADGDKPGPFQSCGYILRGILAAAQCRIYQCNGRWVIRRVNDVVTGSGIRYNGIEANLGQMTINSGVENITARIGRTGYPFINENAVITVKQGLKSFKTTYTANIRQNIVPNGNLNIWVGTSPTEPLYWGTYNIFDLEVSQIPSLDGQDGFAAQLQNVGTPPLVEVQSFTLLTPNGMLGKNGLPIDAYTLVKVINFSFMFSPVSGFNVNGNGIIDFSDTPITGTPFKIKIVLNQGNVTYYLNEFGTWTSTDTSINISIDNMKLGDIAQVNFDKFQGVKIPQPPSEPHAGDTCDLQILFQVINDEKYAVDNISITVDTANDVYEVFDDSSKNTSSDSAELNISSSFGGYMLSNFMTGWYNSDVECDYNDGLLYSGTLTGINSQAVMRFRYKSSQIFNGDINTRQKDWSFDQIYTIDTLLGKKFLPLNAKFYAEKSIANIIAIECRNDNIALRESFYSSNDNTNSN